MIRLIAVYEAEPDAARYEEHAELCRRVPGSTFRHGKVVRTIQGAPELRYYAEFEFPDMESFQAVARSEELVHNVVADALARGGTSTGEHGIGLGKIGALADEHADLIPLMQAIKASFDPNGILNPGKVLPEPVL